MSKADDGGTEVAEVNSKVKDRGSVADASQSNQFDRNECGDKFVAVELYTTSKTWQSVGMWFSDYTGYTESVEEAEQVKLEYEISTGSKYVVGYKRANFGRSFLDLYKTNHKINYEARKRKTASGSPSGSQDIPYDRVPFIVAGKKTYGCRHGQDKGMGAKLKWKKVAEEKLKTDRKFKVRAPRIQPSIKLGCKAEIHITHVIYFPDYELPKDSAYWRSKLSDKLRCAIFKTPLSMQTVDRFYITLCDPKNHNHPLKDAKLTRKAHNLCMESQGGHTKKTRKRRSPPNEMALIQKELQIMRQEIDAAGVSDVDVAPSQSSDVALTQSSDIIPFTPSASALDLSTNANMTTTSRPSKTVAATRCAKVLEKLINATYMVENAEILVELEQKAYDLLKNANTSIQSGVTNTCNEKQSASNDSNDIMDVSWSVENDGISMTRTIPVPATCTSTGITLEDGGLKPTATSEPGDGEGEEGRDIVPVTQSIEYVNVPGVQPSIVYTYGTNSKLNI